MQEYIEKLNHPDWKEQVNDKKEGIIIWQRTTPEGLKAMKAVANVNRPASIILKVIGDDRYRRDYDVVFDGGHNIEKIADQTWFHYEKSKKIAVVAARDFVIIVHMNMVRD
jgi:hypothetical protein